MHKQYLSTSSVAKRWDCSPDLVRKLVRDGAIRAVALSAGKRTAYRVSIQEVERYESQMTRCANPSKAKKITQQAVAFARKGS